MKAFICFLILFATFPFEAIDSATTAKHVPSLRFIKEASIRSFALASVYSATLEGPILTLDIGYGGGCTTHSFDLVTSGRLSKDPKTSLLKMELKVFDYGGYDSCAAYGMSKINIDISALDIFLYDRAQFKVALALDEVLLEYSANYQYTPQTVPFPACLNKQHVLNAEYPMATVGFTEWDQDKIAIANGAAEEFRPSSVLYTYDLESNRFYLSQALKTSDARDVVFLPQSRRLAFANYRTVCPLCPNFYVQKKMYAHTTGVRLFSWDWPSMGKMKETYEEIDVQGVVSLSMFCLGRVECLLMASECSATGIHTESRIQSWRGWEEESAPQNFPTVSATDSTYIFIDGLGYCFALTSREEGASLRCQEGSEFTRHSVISIAPAVAMEGFSIGSDTFLAQGLLNGTLLIMKWESAAFAVMQQFSNQYATDIAFFISSSGTFLAVINNQAICEEKSYQEDVEHLPAYPVEGATLYQWKNEAFELYRNIEIKAPRDWHFFSAKQGDLLLLSAGKGATGRVIVYALTTTKGNCNPMGKTAVEENCPDFLDNEY